MCQTQCLYPTVWIIHPYYYIMLSVIVLRNFSSILSFSILVDIQEEWIKNYTLETGSSLNGNQDNKTKDTMKQNSNQSGVGRMVLIPDNAEAAQVGKRPVLPPAFHTN